jgi:hypothetical protein
MKAPASAVAKQWSRLRQKPSVHSHTIGRQHQLIASYGDQGLQDWHCTVGTRASASPVSAFTGLFSKWLDGAKLNQFGVGVVSSDVDS